MFRELEASIVMDRAIGRVEIDNTVTKSISRTGGPVSFSMCIILLE